MPGREACADAFFVVKRSVTQKKQSVSPGEAAFVKPACRQAGLRLPKAATSLRLRLPKEEESVYVKT
jgi:hypothetical protein